MGLAQPQVLISSLLSHVRLFSLGSPPARWREKREENQPQQKKRFDTDLASTLKDKFFCLCIHLQTFHLGAFSLSSACKLVARVHFTPHANDGSRLRSTWPTQPQPRSLYSCSKTSLDLLCTLSKMALRAVGSRSQAPGGQRSLRRTMASHCGSVEGEETKAGKTWIWPKLQCIQVMVT